MTMKLATAEDTEALGASIGRVIRPGDVIALFGDLGTGKTTLTRGILQALGLEGDVASPTFPIVQTYDMPDVRIPLWHVDLYRIEDPEELDELGLEDARAYAALVIEWPERLGRALWPDALRLRLEAAPEAGRVLTATIPLAWEERWPPQ
jgi:tRNA threonylcarbamoyladenosine biosynthesis protein TsaE